MARRIIWTGHAAAVTAGFFLIMVMLTMVMGLYPALTPEVRADIGPKPPTPPITGKAPAKATKTVEPTAVTSGSFASNLSTSAFRTLNGHKDWIRAVAYSPDSQLVASGSDDKTVRLWEAPTGKLLRVLQSSPKAFYGIHSLVFSPDGRTLAAGTEIVRLWHVQTGRLQHTLTVQGPRSAKGSKSPLSLANMVEAVRALSFSPDGKTLVVGTTNGTMRLWDVGTAAWRSSFQTAAGLKKAVFTPDGKSLALCGSQWRMLWDLEKKKVRPFFASKESGQWEMTISSLAVSPDGTKLIVGGGRRPYQEDASIFDYSRWWYSVQVWDVRTARLLHTLPLDDKMINEVTFSPDGKVIAAACNDGVRTWNTRNWSLRQSIGLKGNAALSLSFSPDAKTLAIGARNGVLHLWPLRDWARGYLGVATEEAFMPEALVKAHPQEDDRCLHIAAVQANGPAARIGLRQGDLLVSINGKTIHRPD